jgi:hypothetical protein
VKVKIIFIAECAGIVKYQVTQSTRLGPSNKVGNVTILDTAHATGKEAHDSLTVSRALNTLSQSPEHLITCQISISYFLTYVMYAYYGSRLSTIYITVRLTLLLEST